MMPTTPPTYNLLPCATTHRAILAWGYQMDLSPFIEEAAMFQTCNVSEPTVFAGIDIGTEV